MFINVIIKDLNVLCDSLIFPLTLAQKPYLETRPENGWIARQVPVYQQPNHPPQSMTPQVALALLTTPQKVKVKFWKQWVFLFLEFLRVCYYLYLEVQTKFVKKSWFPMIRVDDWVWGRL